MSGHDLGKNIDQPSDQAISTNHCSLYSRVQMVESHKVLKVNWLNQGET